MHDNQLINKPRPLSQMNLLFFHHANSTLFFVRFEKYRIYKPKNIFLGKGLCSVESYLEITINTLIELPPVSSVRGILVPRWDSKKLSTDELCKNTSRTSFQLTIFCRATRNWDKTSQTRGTKGTSIRVFTVTFRLQKTISAFGIHSLYGFVEASTCRYYIGDDGWEHWTLSL